MESLPEGRFVRQAVKLHVALLGRHLKPETEAEGNVRGIQSLEAKCCRNFVTTQLLTRHAPFA